MSRFDLWGAFGPAVSGEIIDRYLFAVPVVIEDKLLNDDQRWLFARVRERIANAVSEEERRYGATITAREFSRWAWCSETEGAERLNAAAHGLLCNCNCDYQELERATGEGLLLGWRTGGFNVLGGIEYPKGKEWVVISFDPELSPWLLIEADPLETLEHTGD
jgi:hypothetical protein